MATLYLFLLRKGEAHFLLGADVDAGMPAVAPKSRKKTVLVVDDSPMNRELLVDIMSDEFNVVEAENGEQAIAAVLRLGLSVSLVLLDYVMPGMDGLEVLEVFQKNGWIKDIPVVMLSTESDPKYIERAYELGATDFLVRPFDVNIVLHRARNTIMLYSKQRMLYSMVADELNERERDINLMVSILSHIVEFRNGESGRHVLRVRMLTELLLTYLTDKTDAYSLTPADISLISMASSLHDIGKIVISEAILNKPGRLAPEEFEIMKTHAAVGAEMLENLPVGQDEKLVQTAHDICRWHHERWDGNGYPDGLKGDEIPISAQVVALADVYDALTSERVYKPPYPHERALNMILNGECGAFNPLLLDCLRENAEAIREQVDDISLDGTHPSDTSYTMRYVAESLAQSMDEGTESHELDLMEYERMKYAFFAEMSNETQFEYAAEPSMLVISNHGPMDTGLPDIIVDPLHNERMNELFRERDLFELDQLLRASSPNNPIVHSEMIVMLDDKPRWCAVVARSLWSDDEKPVYIGALGKITDIHDDREFVKSLQFQARHDPLTSLANRSYARRLARKRMESHPDSLFVVIVIDLDKFKQANDSRGHLFGDGVLRYFSSRLNAGVREGDIVARIGGDEFLVFMCCDPSANWHSLVQRVFASARGVYEGFNVSASVGASCSATAGADYDAMIECADSALYTVKRAGGNGCAFCDDLSESERAELRVTVREKAREQEESMRSAGRQLSPGTKPQGEQP